MKKGNLIQYIIVAGLIFGFFYFSSTNKNNQNAEAPEANTNTETGGTTSNTSTEKLSQLAANMKQLATGIGLKEEDFTACYNSEEIAARVEEEKTFGANIGVTWTPSIFILDNQKGVVTKLNTSPSAENIKAILDKMTAGLSGTEVISDLGSGTTKLNLVGLGRPEFPYANNSLFNLAVAADKDYVKGNANARFTIYEYSDYDCPFCKQAHALVQSALDQNSSQLNWVYRQFPLDGQGGPHPYAGYKSKAALCAGKLGGTDAYWRYTDALMKL